MSSHASMNRIFRLVWNEVLGVWVAVAENARGRGKRSVRATALLAPLLAALGLSMSAHAGSSGPIPAPTQLPTGGTVAAGNANIQAGANGGAVLDVDQTSQRAVINWNTFNVGSAATVNFNQPNANSATLNRVLDSNPSQILGHITANGQVFLSNPNGVTFGKSASVDVGSLTATTHTISDADFMAGLLTFARSGSTGSVVNLGTLRASLGGYIALLAPEVRNEGVIVAQLGTVALASGEAITLNFDGDHTLASLTVTPSAIKALVDNKGAVLAPGGLIVLSAKALDRLQGGVINNSGQIEATGMSMKSGRVLLEASDSINNSGTISANAGKDGSPAGSVTLSAPSITNSGTISAAAIGLTGGNVTLQGSTIVQTSTGLIDVSGLNGGSITLRAALKLDLDGGFNASGSADGSTGGQGGSVTATSAGDLTVQDAVIDASGDNAGGAINLAAGQSPVPLPNDPNAPSRAPTLALLGTTELRTSSRRGKGGGVTLTGDQVGLLDDASVDASGATGGGDVYVGGGFQGKNAAIADAQQTVVASGATIDASATQAGDGGKVVVWSDVDTSFGGKISARGGAQSGDGGAVEVSGKQNLGFVGLVDAGADHGQAGTLLLDPLDIIVQTGGSATLSNVSTFAANTGATETIDPSTITASTNAGTAVTLQAVDDITVNSTIATTGGSGALTLTAGRSITLNAGITSNNAPIVFNVNNSGAGTRDAGAAAFVNNSLVAAGSSTVTINMGTNSTVGNISAGQVTAQTLTINQGSSTADTIDLGASTIAGNLAITASTASSITNQSGALVVKGVATISDAGGSVVLTGASTDLNVIGLTAASAQINDTNAVRLGTTNITGNLTVTAAGPIGSSTDGTTGSAPVVVGGTTTLTSTWAGFGAPDPYIDLHDANNDFNNVVLSVPGGGYTGAGGQVTLVDKNAINVTTGSNSIATSLTITAGTTVNLGTTTLGRDLTISSGGAITNSGVITVPEQTTLTAGTGNDITLDNAGNDFNGVQIVSSRNTTLVDKNAIMFGSVYGGGVTSHVSGNLSVTAGGDISQYLYNYPSGYSQITVDGTSLFTAANATSQINLYLGSPTPFDGTYTGQANTFTGAITLAAANGNTGFSNVYLRNTSTTASAINGLSSVGTLSNVLLRYDNAPSLALSGMTITGNLDVYAPSIANTGTTSTNILSETGAIVVGGSTLLAVASTGDIVLTNTGNDFNQFGIVNTGARNVSVTDTNAIVLYAPGYNQAVTGNFTTVAGGNISDVGNNFSIAGIASFDAGTNNVTLTNTYALQLNHLAIPNAGTVNIRPWTSVILDNVNTTGALTLTSYNGGTLTQSAGTAVTTPSSSTTTFNLFNSGITLGNTSNVLGNLAITNAGAITIRENDPITQASAWTTYNTSGSTNSSRYAVSLTTSNDQAITLGQTGNVFGDLTITQVNSGASSAGAVLVRETGDTYFGLTEGSAWTVHGTLTLDSGATSIAMANANNTFGPLQVTGATGQTNGAASTVTIYAKAVGTADAITDVGATGAWTAGTGTGDSVRLVAYDSTGTTAGGGNITLANTSNVLGDLYLKATNAAITENDSITDGVSTTWDAAGDTGWAVSGNLTMTVANPTGKTITLDNLGNVIGPIAINTTGTAGTLTSVLVTDNANLTQSAAWLVGTAPVTLDARAHAINLSTYANVLGNLSINTVNGTPTSVAITENDAITQGSVWSLTGVPVTLVAQNGNAITLTNASNVMGNLTITGGAVSITENDAITQGGAWTTTGTTTLNATTNAITLTNSANVLGPIAIGGTPSAVSITENDDITQASAWVQPSTPFTLNAGTHNVVLTQASNQLGDLTITAQNASITEADPNGITDANAWTVPGTTTLTAGSANPIVLNANPASDFGTVNIVSASNADIADANAIVFSGATVAGTLTVTAGGAITQTGAITAPSLRLIGTGNATLNTAGNNVGNLAAGFSGGDLSFTDSGSFAVAVIGGTTGVTIGAHNVTLVSSTGTITGLSNVNASSTSLALTTGTALSLPQMNIAGPQTYTASTVSGSGITLTSGITSTAAGAITFNSPVTLGADLSVQSSNSPIHFASTLAGGGNQLTVNAGSGTAAFDAAVSGLGTTSDAGAALNLTSSGATFASTLGANNGLTVTGPVVFDDNVTLANGNAASVFAGQVTLGKAGGMNFSGYDGLTFNGGVVLVGPSTITSNNSPLAFQTAGSVAGPYALTLDSGTAALTGLDRMGTNLTSLTVTALSPTIPSGGVSISGPQSYTATSGSSINIGGAVTSTAAGAIVFNSPVNVSASSTVTSSNSQVEFLSTVDGAHDLTVNSGTGTKTFTGAVGSISSVGDGTGAAIILQGTGDTTFDSTVAARSGMTVAGTVTFDNNVTLANGDTPTVFSSLVTSGGTSGNTISGYDGVAFNGGLAVVGGPVTVDSNGGTLALGGPVTGTQHLALNALGGGTGTITGLAQIGAASTLTRLDLTGQTLSLPSTGLAVNGPMTATAAGGITLNGAVGSDSAPATGQIDFNGPVTLATGAITVTAHNAAVNFNGTVDGAEALTVNAGTGTTTFGGAVGGTTALASISTDAAGTTALNGATVRTTGAQTYAGAVTLGVNDTLTGVNVSFDGTLDGAHALVVDDSGTTTFAGVVGGTTPLASIVTDAPGSVAVNTSAVTTSGSQTYNENVTLGQDATFQGAGITFGAAVDGAHALTANAGSGALQFNGTVGGSTPLTSVAATGATVSAHAVDTSGAQSYTGSTGVTLGGNLDSTASGITITGPTTLGADVTVATGVGSINFSGVTSSINGAHALTLTAGNGDVTLGGVVGGATPLTSVDITGNNLTLPAISTVGDTNQTYAALNNLTLDQSRTVNAAISFTADADHDGNGTFILLNGVSLTASNQALTITAADLDLQGNSTMSSGSGLMTINASNGHNIALGGSDAAGQMTISGSELSRMSSSGGLELATTGAGWVHVNGITSAQSQNITGPLTLDAQGTGDVDFVTTGSTFNAVTATATGGTINVGVNLTTTNDPIVFTTPVTVSGASTIDSGGGNITFQSTVAVQNDLTLSTGNGTLAFDGAVGSNKTLTLNLGGGAVTGLGQLQNTLTGLTVNSTSGITLPAFAINGPQVYNTGVITATGDLSGVGITFNNVVNVAPASGTALALNSGTGTLAFNDLASFNANNMTLTGDEINFSKAVTGSGSLLLQPSTLSRNVAVGGSGAPITGLNLTASDIGWLPIGTLSSLTIGSAAGTGTLDVAGTINAPGKPLTLNGGGGITESAGTVVSGNLTLYAAGNAISLNGATNAFGAVGINGTPTSLTLDNTQNITQLGSAGWNLGSGNATLNAGTQDIILTNAGNNFGTIALSGRNAQVVEASATDLGASTLTGSLTLTSAGAVTQSGALAIGGDMTIVTTVAAGNVAIDNSGASATTIGDTFVGGDYVLTATNEAVSQAPATSLQVRGDLTVTGDSIVLGGAGNLVGGTTTLPGTSTVEVRQAGVITLGNRDETGNLTVISERTNRSFGSALVGGSAITLDNSANNIGGKISVTASAPTIVTGADVQTGINQAAGTSITVAGIASFTAEASSAGSLGINLTNAGNSFGTLQLSGNTVAVKNSATGTTTIGSALATTSLSLDVAGPLAQTGAITTPALTVTAAGNVALTNVANSSGSIDISTTAGNVAYTDANGVAVAGISAGGGNVALVAGNGGAITQTGALEDVGTLTASTAGSITLDNTGNTIAALGATSAGIGLDVYNSAGGLTVAGTVRTLAGDVQVRTSGDLTIASGAKLQSDAGNVVASAEDGGNFINQAGTSALVAGTGMRWLVYSTDPDLDPGAHTVKDGLTSSFRHYGTTYGQYSPGSVTESGNGFIYSQAAGTLTVSAVINGSATQVYGNTPTGTIGYVISSGLLDSEDNIGNIISGGTATYNMALANTMNVGSYSVKYTGGLTSAYTLVADTNGAAYTVTPATLTYVANTASRLYGAADPSLGGTITGFKLSDNASVLSGTATWTTDATATSNVAQYAIDGSGYSAANYVFAQAPANATALTINKAPLTITASGDSRTYDGTSYSGGTGVSYSGFANNETAAVLGGTLGYTGSSQGARNAGTYAITPTGLTSGNYDITYDSGTLVIAKANLTLTANDVTKTYDGALSVADTAVATAGTQLFGSDTLSGGAFAYTNANAGTGKTVNASGVTVNDGNGGNNYNVTYVANTSSVITQANLVLSAADVTKTYDGTLAATDTAVVVSGTLFHNASNGGALDSLSGGTFAYTDKNAGSGDKTVTASGVTVNDGSINGNYNVTYVDNTTSTINKATLGFVGTVADKTYDGTTTASLTGYTLTGLVGNETLGASATSANFADKNAATGKTVDIGGISLADGSNGGLASNYTIAATATTTATITPKVLNVDAVVNDKTYDGTTSATLQSYGLSGFVGNETVVGVYTGSASFSDKNVGTDKAVTITGINLVNGSNGGLASNYVVSTSASSAASITPATLQVAGVVAVDKVYDGTTTAQLNTSAAVLAGVIGSDNVSVNSITGTFADKNVGTDKPISGGTYTLSGTDAGNYVLVQPAGLSASITPRSLDITATAVNKTYDGTTAATISLADNAIAGDSLTLDGTGAFLDKNAGNGKYVAVTGITVGGADAGNYVYNTSTAAFANIAKATLNVVATGSSKVYDATTAATVSLTDTPLGNDAVSVNYVSAAFSDKNVGTGKTINVGGVFLTGADADDYTVASSVTTTGNITPATITQVTGIVAANKVYDGTTAASFGGGQLGFVGMLPGDSLTATATQASFADKNVGTDKPVTISGLALGGTDAGNYVLATTTMQGSGNITPAVLTVSASAQNKVYDSTLAATASLSDNAIAGDVLTLNYVSAAFTDKNAGVGKVVNVSGITLGGADAGNYTFNTTASTTADITKATLTANATASTKVYDGTTADTVSLSATPLGSDQVTLSYGSAAFADKNVGQGKTVTVNGVTLGGADAGNYTVAGTTTATGNITPATLTVGAVGQGKLYDGTTAAVVTFTDNRITGDDITLADTSASFANAMVGNNKAISVVGIHLAGGADAGNYVIADTTATAHADISGYTDTWSRQPQAPVPLAPTPTAPPPSVLDLTPPGVGGLPATPGSPSGGTSGTNGTDGTNGTNGTNGSNGTSGSTSGQNGSDGGQGGSSNGQGGTNGASGSISGSGTIGTDIGQGSTNSSNGSNGTSGSTSGQNGSDGSQGGSSNAQGGSNSSSGSNGANGQSGSTSGQNGSDGSQGGSSNGQGGSNSSNGSNGASSQSGSTSNQNGSDGSQGSSSNGQGGSNSSNGTSGANGQSGSTSGQNGSDGSQGGSSNSQGGSNSSNGSNGANGQSGSTSGQNGSDGSQGGSSNGQGGSNSSNGSNGTNGQSGSTTGQNGSDGSQGGSSNGQGGSNSSNGSNGTNGQSGSTSGQNGSDGSQGGSSNGQGGSNSSNGSSGTNGQSGSTSSSQSNATSAQSNASASTSGTASTQSGSDASQSGSTGEQSGSAAGRAGTASAQSVDTPAAAATDVAPVDTGSHVIVTLVLQASTVKQGDIAVSVPKPIAESAYGFSFPLPKDVVEAAGKTAIKATLPDGSALPSWLRYVPATHVFVVSAVPSGALPLEVLVRSGKRRWTVTVTQRTGH